MQEALASAPVDVTTLSFPLAAWAYTGFLGDSSDVDFHTEIQTFDDSPTSKGAFIVNLVLGGHAAYYPQLFLCLKAGGREELRTTNLWQGVNSPPPAAS